MGTTTIDRRGFLRLSTGVAAASVAGLGFIGCDVGAAEDRWEDAERARAARRAEAARRAALYVSPDQAAAFGERYLAAAALDADDDAAFAVLEGVVDGLVDADSDAAAVAWLEASIAHDFVIDELVLLEGWVMSATELKVCALLHLVG